MKSKLNICIISQEFPPYNNWGGIASYYDDFSNMCAQLGHRVTVISRQIAGVPVFVLLDNGVGVWRVGWASIRKYFIGRTIDKIFHAKAVYKKVRELDAYRPFDVIEATEVGLDCLSLLKDDAFAKRIVVQCHGSNRIGSISEGIFSLAHKMDFALSYRIEKDSLERVSRIIVPSEATRLDLLNNEIKPEKMKVIYEGIDTDRFVPGSTFKLSYPLRVGFIGRFEKIKGIDFIWKVIEKISPEDGIRFDLKGEIHWSLRKETKRNLDRFASLVAYHPRGKREEVKNLYQKVQILLQPSRFENFGLVYAEGMASGLVVFAGRNGSGPEIVKDKKTGFLIDPDQEGEVDRVVSILKEFAANPSALTNLGHRARKDAVERFSLSNHVEKKIRYYKEIAK
jgi:glycosyltransferase involved in cell wall biosynthesis